ncbi:hypothetical protein CMUST_06870 [Corynebacterium mustelae]|uniref:Uncharacterized protein n=1 Tax=Corynebacterium mustelae TaxID=571915 RepID=A0A0G3H1M5_9CORY|nr:hypothetical protein [Corynebacterium mustelae]AKK05708.1 hypothetical protein CMUST_06870 [Corynebacterium mustelae]
MKPTILDAVAVYRKLGWDTAELSTLPHMPVGTDEEQKVARAGLATGSLLGLNNVNRLNLRLFALCVGVPPRHAAELIDARYTNVTVACIRRRGETYARELVREISKFDASSLGYQNCSSPHHVAFTLVNETYLQLPVPTTVGYLVSWLHLAARHYDVSESVVVFGDPSHLPITDTLPGRIGEHLEVFAKSEVAKTSLFSKVVMAALQQGNIDRATACAVLFTALDNTTRKSDKTQCVKVLRDELSITDAELLTNSAHLMPLLESGDAVITSAFAPRLLEIIPEQDVTNLAIAALCQPTQKTQKATLTALHSRADLSPKTITNLHSQVIELVKSKYPGVATPAQRLLDRWGYHNPNEEDHGEDKAPSVQWLPTPNLWATERVRCAGSTVTLLVDAAREALRDPLTTNLATETFFALAVQLAWSDPVAAKRALTGLPKVGRFIPLQAWAKNMNVAECFEQEHDFPIGARDGEAAARLGDIPCLLSSPSFSDLSITLADFCARLDTFELHERSVGEADLYLALCRLVCCNSSQLDELCNSTVAVKQTLPTAIRRKTLYTVGEVITELLSLPGHTFTDSLVETTLLRPRLQVLRGYGHHPDFTILPRSGEETYHVLRWAKTASPEKLSAYAAQVACLANPLPPAALINFLGLMRPTRKGIDPRIGEAIITAWQRGLLREENVDVQLLDWGLKPQVKPLLEPLGDLAQAGLVAIVWPILDGFLEHANAMRLSAATCSLVLDLMQQCLPADDMLKKSELRLTGLHSHAHKESKGKTVSKARAILHQIQSGKD